MNISIPKPYLIVISLLLLYFAWGTAFIANKLALEYFPALLVVALRLLIGGACLLGFLLYKGKKLDMNLQKFKSYNISAFLLMFCATAFLVKGQESVSSGLASIIYGASPIWMLLGGWLIWGEARPSIKQFLGLFLGFIVITGLGYYQGDIGGNSFFGMTLIVLSTFSWVWGSYVSKNDKATASDDVFISSAILMLVGGFQSLIFSFAIGEQLDFSILTFDAFLPVLHLSLVTCGVGYVCYFWLFDEVSPAAAISYVYASPIIGVFCGWLIGNEHFDYITILACFALVISVVLTTRK